MVVGSTPSPVFGHLSQIVTPAADMSRAVQQIALLTQASGVERLEVDEWVNVVLTRSRAGRLRGYVDGQQVFDFTDTTAGKMNSLNTLRFFRDNDNREETSGAVSRIRLYNDAMTPAQVAALGT